jgi:hypothetical protein
MTRRGIKQEKFQAEDIEEVVMPSPMKPKRKARADVNEVDLEMFEAPSFSTSSFPAMPTPSSFADDGPAEVTANGRQRGSGIGKQKFSKNLMIDLVVADRYLSFTISEIGGTIC